MDDCGTRYFPLALMAKEMMSRNGFEKLVAPVLSRDDYNHHRQEGQSRGGV